MSAWDEKKAKHLKKLFKKYNKDNKIDKTEIASALKEFGYKSVSDADATAVVAKADKNNDGKISYEEFEAALKEFVQSHPRDSGYKSDEEIAKLKKENKDKKHKEGHKGGKGDKKHKEGHKDEKKDKKKK
eukprot:TRINITY_DN547_c0_g2_i2.p1 TRINITY_DN547_c0_g2~~TRINITY_DN547_c0_g2_i2.p1  ORF type:complete len:151 (+),score=53.45 TRINITY_DN547_c0_g2_i2:64-453(+)